MGYKLVTIDLDGTLLNGKYMIGNKTAELMKKAISLGVKFAMCSARIYLSTKYYSAQIDKEQPVITSNGGLITINKKTIFSNPLDSEDLIKVIDIAKEENKDIFFSFGYGNYSQNFICTNRETSANRINSEYNQTVTEEFKLGTKLLMEPVSFLKENNVKSHMLSFIDDNSLILDKLRMRLKILDKYEITSSEASNIEITQKNVSKGNALKMLAEYYGYSLDECIAIGNDKNDLSMINQAGLGVAMRNASPFLKKHSDYITENDNENDGVAEVIEKFILGNKKLLLH